MQRAKVSLLVTIYSGITVTPPRNVDSILVHPTISIPLSITRLMIILVAADMSTLQHAANCGHDLNRGFLS
jgi:hypothetical protein